MHINKFVARATGLSRRVADKLADNGQILVNGRIVKPGQEVSTDDTVELGGKKLSLPETTTIIFNKPIGYVCSRDGQGSNTIYDILPKKYHDLKPVGRLDKDSSGFLLLTNDGDLAQKLTHPSYQKQKIYEIRLDKPLARENRQKIEQGVDLEDGISKLIILNGQNKNWTVKMSEGRNRQIRRTFAALGYTVTKLHRVRFGDYELNDLDTGSMLPVNTADRIS